MPAKTTNQELLDWVEQWRSIFEPDEVYWCDGSAEEYDRLCQQLVDAGTFEQLNDAKRPNSYLALSDPADVARVEDRTFICSEQEIDAGPTNNWRDPAELKAEMLEQYRGAMKGRTMYVVPFSMGPLGSPIAHIGVQLTDSPYVAVNMRIMTRMGQGALDVLGADGEFVPCLHSVGYPLVLADGPRADVPWPCDATTSTSPLPRDPRDLVATARATAATPCSARSASPCASPRPWPATRAGWPSTCSSSASPRPTARSATSPAAFPSACGKTNMAMLIPTPAGLEGRDRRRRHRLDEVRRRRPALRHQPRGRLLRRGPRHRPTTPTPTPWPRVEANTIFTNVAKTDDGDVWWEEHDRRAAGSPHRLEGQRLDARVRHPRRPPQRPLHRPGRAVPVDRPRVGGPHGRADLGHPLRRPPRHQRARSSPRRSTGSTACSSARS